MSTRGFVVVVAAVTEKRDKWLNRQQKVPWWHKGGGDERAEKRRRRIDATSIERLNSRGNMIWTYTSWERMIQVMCSHRKIEHRSQSCSTVDRPARAGNSCTTLAFKVCSPMTSEKVREIVLNSYLEINYLACKKGQSMRCLIDWDMPSYPHQIPIAVPSKPSVLTFLVYSGTWVS